MAILLGMRERNRLIVAPLLLLAAAQYGPGFIQYKYTTTEPKINRKQIEEKGAADGGGELLQV